MAFLDESNSRRNSHRDAPVRCAACGRTARRKSRQQKFCSDRCRQFALRENRARHLNARGALKNPSGYQDGGRVTQPNFFTNKNNGLQGAKSGSSIPLNVLGGYRWPNAVGVERDVLRKIIRAEIGGPP
jgi:hypothetical protein